MTTRLNKKPTISHILIHTTKPQNSLSMSVPSVPTLNSLSPNPCRPNVMGPQLLIDTFPAARCSRNSHSIRKKWSIKISKTTSPEAKAALYKSQTSTESASLMKVKKIPNKPSASSKHIKTATSSSTIQKPEAKEIPLLISQSWAKALASNSPKI